MVKLNTIYLLIILFYAYNQVSRTTGLTSSELNEFYRFFRTSGMGKYPKRPNSNPELTMA
jgi:hypothetical protein